MHNLKKYFFLSIKIGFVIGMATAVVITVYCVSLYQKAERILYERLVEYNSPLTTQVLDKKGDLVANIFGTQHRLFTPYEDIPTPVIEALIATEDTGFFEHNGINIEAIFRAVVKNIKAGGYVEGASTITQQLVRTALLTRDKTLIRKLKEAVLSIKLTELLTKEEVLERYLNEVYFGHGYYGIRTAANGYFHKELHTLSLKEIAILVGLPKAPSFYDPTRNYDKSLKRANNVLLRLKALGWVDTATFLTAFNENPTVYNDSLSQNKAPYVVDYLKYLTKDTLYDLQTGGYVFEISIDLALQKSARDALRYGYKNIYKREAKALKQQIREEKTQRAFLLGELNSALVEEALAIENNITLEYNLTAEINGTDINVSRVEFLALQLDELNQSSRIDYNISKNLNGAIISLDSSNGDILAMVGGVDYRQSSFNRVYQANRQPGSSIKPFIYQIALDHGYAQNTNLIDITRSYEYEKEEENLTWRPKNYEDNVKGIVKLNEALIHSRNLATINLVSDIGLNKVYRNLTNYGFSGVPRDLSISLGSFGASPLQMASNYSIFANAGQKVQPTLIKRIKQRGYDDIVFESTIKRVTSAEQTFLITSLLKETVDRGTGRGGRVKNIELAGKTGTTNNNADAWFCGYSPSILTVVWYGNNDSTAMNKRETGGRSAAPAFGYFYRKALSTYPHLARKFPIPEEVKKKGEYYYTKTSPLQQESKAPQNKLIF